MSELEKKPNHESSSSNQLNQGDKKEIINLELTDDDSSDLLIVEIDCDNENQGKECSSERVVAEESAAGRKLINLEFGDLAEPDKPHRLKVVLGDVGDVSQSDNVEYCHFCGSIIDPFKKQCNVCFSKRAEVSDPSKHRNTFKFLPLVYAGILILFIVLSVYAMQIRTESVAPDPTPSPVPSTPEPVPIPRPTQQSLAVNSTIQDAINAAADGDVIAIPKIPYYGPLDFKGKNLSIVLDENVGVKNSNATRVAVSGAVITLFEAEKIESLLKSYSLIDDINSNYKRLNYNVQTNYYDFPEFPGTYIVFDAEGNNLVVRGKAGAPGEKLIVEVESGSFKGEHLIESGDDAFFRAVLKNTSKQEGVRSETVKIDTYHGDKNSKFLNQFYAGLLVHISFEGDKLTNILFEKPLAYDGNAKAWNTYRDPSQYLKAESTIQAQDPKIIGLADSLVKQGMSDFQKLVAIHQWVTTNITYDVRMLATGKRAPQDAVSVFENKLAVCEGYAKLMAALLRSQGISTRYVTGNALGSHDPGSGWEEEGLYNHPIGHAWNEIYIDGDWITVDATWNAGYIDSATGKFIFAQRFSYFAPTLELFSRTHFIP